MVGATRSIRSTISSSAQSNAASVPVGTRSGLDQCSCGSGKSSSSCALPHTVAGSWSEFLTGGGEASCLGPLSGLDKQRAVYAAAVAALADPLLRRRAAAELGQIQRATTHTDRYVVIPALAEEPVGIPALTALTPTRLEPFQNASNL